MKSGTLGGLTVMIDADRSGADPLALETYLMNLNWLLDVDVLDDR